MTRNTLAALGGLLLAAGAHAQIELGEGSLPYAQQIPSNSTIEMPNSPLGRFSFELGFGISEGDERFIRVDLVNATFPGPVDETLFSCDDNPGNCAFALGTSGDDFIIVGLSAVGASLAPGETIVFALQDVDGPGDLVVMDTSTDGNVSLRYRLYEDPVNASQPGGGTRTLTDLPGEIIEFVDGLVVGLLDDPPDPGLCVADVAQESLAFAESPPGSRFPFENNGAATDTQCFCNRIVQRGRLLVWWSDGRLLGANRGPGSCPTIAPCGFAERATFLLLGGSETAFEVEGDLPLDFAAEIDILKGNQNVQKGFRPPPFERPDPAPEGGFYLSNLNIFVGVGDSNAAAKGPGPTRFPDCSTGDFLGELTDGNASAVIDTSGGVLLSRVFAALCLSGNGVDPFNVDEYFASWSVVDNDPDVEFDEPERELGLACSIDKNGSEDALVFNLSQGGFYTQFIRITNPTNVDGRVFLDCYDDANDQSKRDVPLSTFPDRDGEMLPDVLGANQSTDLININDVWTGCDMTPAGGPGSPNGTFLRLIATGEFGTDENTTGQGESRGIRIEGVTVSRDGNAFENTSR